MQLSIRKYAQHRGISHTAVEKAIRQGRIRTNADGRIDLEQADLDWQRNTGPAVPPAPPDSGHAAGQRGPSFAQSRS